MAWHVESNMKRGYVLDIFLRGAERLSYSWLNQAEHRAAAPGFPTQQSLLGPPRRMGFVGNRHPSTALISAIKKRFCLHVTLWLCTGEIKEICISVVSWGLNS